MKTVIPATTARITDISCDRCGAAYSDDADADTVERQEFLSFQDTGGYGSVHGDGTTWSIDLCQYCTKKLLGLYIQIISKD